MPGGRSKAWPGNVRDRTGRLKVAIGIGLRQVQDALERKAVQVQNEFIRISEELEDLGRKLLESEEEERRRIREEQQKLRVRQQEVAEEVNLWRKRAREVLRQPGVGSLRAYLDELLSLNEPLVTATVERALQLLDTPPEERGPFQEQASAKEQTPAERLLERARTEYDLRSSDPSARMREAITFANRPGMAQDDDIVHAIAEAMEDPDPLVRELATFTTIQLHRFRAMRFADLDAAHQAVQVLARINHPAVIPALIEIVEKPRIGYVQEEGQAVNKENGPSRMIALLRLVEWHTAEAQNAIRALTFDRDEHIVKAAKRALELFPGPWTGPIKSAKRTG